MEVVTTIHPYLIGDRGKYCELLNLDTTTLKDYVANFHSFLDLPVKDVIAENILVRSLADNGYRLRWDQGSHKPGSDVFIFKDGNIGISVKAAKQPQKGEGLSISSYRTESWDTLQEKRDGIRKIEEEIQSYVIFARTESKKRDVKIVDYNIYMIEPALLAIDSFTISGPNEKGDYQGNNKLGVKIVIVKKMSSQVWYTVPMTLVKDGGDIIKRICEIGPFSMKLWAQD